MNISMNPKGSPWCNGAQESFFGRFKVEFGDFDRFDTLADLLEVLYEQLHYFSNIRIKTRLKMSPAEFREKWESQRQQLSTIIHRNPQVMSLPPDPPPPLRVGVKRLLLFELDVFKKGAIDRPLKTFFRWLLNLQQLPPN